ncbi:MAG TPA: T9SS type A sorting domain-containing protein, partial [Lutibacter sp.]|nr:T9SS type A sorting domain-containing protein [Lutibacter sp.]
LIISLSTLVNAQEWSQIGNDLNGEASLDYFGYKTSLSSDGYILAVGGYQNDGSGTDAGHVRVFQNNTGTWTQIGNDIDGETAQDHSSRALSLSADGNIVAIGAMYNNGNGTNSGHVRIFENMAGVWTQIGDDIDGENANDFSGYSVSLSGDGTIVAIGSVGSSANGANSGQVRIFKNLAGNWTQVGTNINGEAAGDHSGYSVSISADGTIVAIGAYKNAGNGIKSGHVRVYQNNAGTWTQIGDDIDGEAANDYSGVAVSLSADGSIVAIGAYGNDGSFTEAGHVRVYQNDTGTWTQIGDDIDGEATNDLSGTAVSLNSEGNILAIGARANGGNGANSGHVRIYQNNAGIWSQKGEDIDGEATDDLSGSGLSLSSNGLIVAIGAPGNDANGTASGHVRVFGHESLGIDTILNPVFSIYPNPSNSIITIEDAVGFSITISDSTGRIIKKIENKENKLTFDISNQTTGIYYLSFKKNELVIHQKVIKN